MNANQLPRRLACGPERPTRMLGDGSQRVTDVRARGRAVTTSAWPPLARGFVRFRPSAAVLLVATLALAAAAWGTRRAGGSVVPGGLLDETVHLLTALLVLWAFGRTACERFLVPALIASVAIDVDHIPDRLGSDWLTAGTPRPYPHSLVTIAGILIVALLWRRRRDLLVGVALGLALHFWWDLAESNAGVPLLWPLSYRSFTLPFGTYVFPMILVLVVDTCRVRARAAAERARLRS
jgi:inner membrane protein